MVLKSKKILEKVDKSFKKKRSVTMYIIFMIVIITVILSGVSFYLFGHSEGYNKKSVEINTENQVQQQRDLMGMELEQVWEIFLKYLMIKIMFWLPWIIAGIILGWILHGIL